MQCRVPPGDTSQLTTGIGSFLSTPLRETSGTALTEPRAHSRIHCIARSVAFSLLAANRTFSDSQPLCGDWCCLDDLNIQNVFIYCNTKCILKTVVKVNILYFHWFYFFLDAVMLKKTAMGGGLCLMKMNFLQRCTRK